MRYLWILLFLIGCTQEYTFEVYTDNEYIKDESFVVKVEGSTVEAGVLPFTITAEEGDRLTAEFEAHVSNFGSSYPQCNCEYITYKYFKCVEVFEVTGKNWEIAK